MRGLLNSLESEDANVAIAGSELPNVSGVAGCDDGGWVMRCRGDNECVDGVCRRELESSKKLPGVLSNSAGEIDDENRAGIEQVIDCRVVARPAAYFSEDWSWNADETARLVCNGDDGARADVKGGPVRRMGEGVECFRIED